MNIFMQNSLIALGGGELSLFDELKTQVRIGGDVIDCHKYMHNYDVPDVPSLFYFLDFETVVEDLFHGYKFSKFDRKCMIRHDVPFATSPGPLYQAMGFKTKGEALPWCLQIVHCFLDDIQKKGSSSIDVLWGLSGRPKLVESKKAMDSLINEKSIGRGVWVPDMHETIIGKSFFGSLSDILTGNLEKETIAIGFDRKTQSQSLKKVCDKFDNVIMCDYSKFDSSIPAWLIEKAFSIIDYMIDPGDLIRRKVLVWYRNLFINSKIVTQDGTVFQKNKGIPSGSAMTSMIGSIVNYLILSYVVKAFGWLPFNFKIIVYGDDSLLFFNNVGDMEDFDNIRSMMILFVKNCFGVTVKEEELFVGPVKFVSYSRPVYRENPINGTSKLKVIRWKKMDKEPSGGLKCRKLKHFKGFVSHRWHYSFTGVVKFLSYYMRDDGYMMRPSKESIARILLPEDEVRSIDDHITRLKMSVIDNFHNIQYLNKAKMYLYDAYLMSKLKIFSKENAKNTIDYSYSRKKKKEGDRGWYRTIRGCDDFRNFKCMDDFYTIWDSFLHDASVINSPNYKGSFSKDVYKWKRFLSTRLMHTVNFGMFKDKVFLSVFKGLNSESFKKVFAHTSDLMRNIDHSSIVRSAKILARNYQRSGYAGAIKYAKFKMWPDMKKWIDNCKVFIIQPVLNVEYYTESPYIYRSHQSHLGYVGYRRRIVSYLSSIGVKGQEMGKLFQILFICLFDSGD